MSKIIIDDKEVTQAFAKSPSIFLNEIRIAIKKGLVLIQRQARAKHRFKSKTGFLKRSIKWEFKSIHEPGKVTLDTGVAIYGPRIHRGWGTWAPDRFLDEAADEKEADVINLIDEAIGKAILKAGF